MGLPNIFNIFKRNDDDEELRDIAVKHHNIISLAIQLLLKEYPKKFGKKVKFKGDLNEEIITLKGNFNIDKKEIYMMDIEYEGEKENYKVILNPNSKSNKKD